MYRRIALLFAVACTLVVCAAAQAQPRTFPGKPVRVIVPYPAGSQLDVVVRSLAAEMGKGWGQGVVVENRPGAGAIIGADACAKSAPDGYTVCVLDKGPMSYAPYLVKNLAYDPTKDFEPVAVLFELVAALIVNNALQVQSFDDFVKTAKARPNTINFGSVGEGSMPHIVIESISRKRGLALVHVPYPGPPPMLQAFMAGDIHVAYQSVGAISGVIRAGKAKPIAQGGTSRSPLMPTVPTLAELGIDVDDSVWFALFAPAGTPKEVVGRYYEELARAFAIPQVRDERMLEQGFAPTLRPAAELARLMATDRVRAGEVVREIGLTPR